MSNKILLVVMSLFLGLLSLKSTYAAAPAAAPAGGVKEGVISVGDAWYGYKDPNRCNAMPIVKKCEGLKSCELRATETLCKVPEFPGQKLQPQPVPELTVHYICGTRGRVAVIKEGQLGKLDCEM